MEQLEVEKKRKEEEEEEKENSAGKRSEILETYFQSCK